LDIQRVAQNNIALYRQMHDLGYSVDALDLVRKSYAIACSLFTSRFRATEKPFLCHLAGTASIMAYLLAKPHLVAAAMLHAAYESGNFGYCYGGPTRRNRERVRGAVGDAVEEIVFRYWKTTWNAKQVSQVAGRANALSSEDKDVVVLRLANSLEDHLDLAMCYCAQSRREYDGTLQELRELAQSLGLHELGESFASISNEMRSASWTSPLGTSRTSSYRLDPRGTIDVSGAISRLRRQLLLLCSIVLTPFGI
jgi:(p)ppGpp synthase/HD superfamily hydrolase